MKNTTTILKTTDLTPNGNKSLQELFNVVPLSLLDKYQKEIKALVTVGGVKVDKELIEKLPNLEVIVNRGVGFDHIDIEAASKKGIVVSNTPDVLTACVADLAFGALIAISRQIVQADKFVRDGNWLNGKYPFTTKVSGKNLGIVGFGRIGQAIAKRANGFDMCIKYYSRTKKENSQATYESSLKALAKWADYLMICAPGGKDTENMISLEILEALGSKAYLINIARGSLVDEKALIDAISKEKIAGAALDVFVYEPKVPKELIESNKVVLLPHIASRTNETIKAMEELVIQNLEKYFTTGELLTPVKKG